MTMKLLPDEISRQMSKIYNNMRDYRGNCVDRRVCKGMCCLQNLSMSYVEFAYLADYLMQNFPEEKAREILTRDKTPFIAQNGKLRHFCSIHEGADCLGYPARPFRCRSYIMDEKRDCRPLGELEMDHKSWRRIWRLDSSIVPPGILEKENCIKENYINFWVREVLKD